MASTWALWLLLRASVSALRLRIGKTQGMMLSTSPPASAPRTASVISRHENATGWPVPEAAIGTPSAGTGPAWATKLIPPLSLPSDSTPESIVGLSAEGALLRARSTMRVSPLRLNIWGEA
jgi:hypothetical protein